MKSASAEVSGRPLWYSEPVHRVIFHLDMDAFYASVEQRDNPSLRGRPVIVGSPPDKRGVVCAASYEARKFGVRSAMPSRTAQRICPAGVFIRPRMEAYRTESHAIMGLLTRFGGAVEQVSVDEAYLDMSHRFAAFDPEAVMGLGREMKDQARELAEKLGKERLAARTVQIKVRYTDFTTLTRQTSVEDPVETADDIYAIACSILRRERLVDRPLRLLGLGVTGLVPPSLQIPLPL